jgi:hypothetical protein
MADVLRLERMLDHLVVCCLIFAGWKYHHHQWLAPKRCD